MELVERLLAGDPIALAKLITRVENHSTDIPQIMRQIQRHTGRAYRIGITGPPGAGKSTFTDQLTAILRGTGATVGIVAIDPTSPFSGGALLGDRIRMQRHYLDPGVFIRSMGTRGSHGGLSIATKDVVKLMDAFGKDFILVETVGVGQTELDVMSATDTVVVILVPESGDAVQTMKAGLMEIADVFVVNKADRGGADRVKSQIELMLHMNSTPNPIWQPPVLLTEAEAGKGVQEVFEAIQSHRHIIEESDDLTRRRQENNQLEFIEIIEEMVRKRLRGKARSEGLFADHLHKVQNGDIDPYTAAYDIFTNEQLLRETFLQKKP